MTFATCLTIVLVGLLLYYAGMIGYDLYMAKMARLSDNKPTETIADAEEDNEEFKPIVVDTKSMDSGRKKILKSMCSRAMTALNFHNTQESIAKGEPNPDLNNLLFQIGQIKESE